MIAEGVLDEIGVDTLAHHLHISTRQLRRYFVHELGAPPVAIAQTRRLLFAKKLIDETTLPMSEVAFSVGYSSIRRFNDALRQTYGRTPTALRKSRRNARGEVDNACIQLKLFYRLPYDWCSIMDFLHARAILGVETVNSDSYRRTVQFGETAGVIEVRPVPGERYCLVRTPLALSRYLLRITERIKRLFDLKADPTTVADHLSMDERLSATVRVYPGLRLPGAWDGFEMVVRTILEQQDCVRMATVLCGRLAGRYGDPLSERSDPGLSRVFPTPERLATVPLTDIGLPPKQAEVIRTLAAAVAKGRWSLETAPDLNEVIEQLTAYPGIGAWGANMIAMRVLGQPDAFPSGDLILRRAAATNGDTPLSEAQLLEQATAWQPWRAYAAMYLWTHYANREGYQGSLAQPVENG
jgi:AraC family transcriptional regulator of adaptative response / DNA-3-methyladenine glycosylase II